MPLSNVAKQSVDWPVMTALSALSSLGRDFVWGVATSAYQIEGDVAEHRRRESLQDRFCATPGQVRNGGSGQAARGHVNRPAVLRRYPGEAGWPATTRREGAAVSRATCSTTSSGTAAMRSASGRVHVDCAAQKRIPTNSYSWLQRLLEQTRKEGDGPQGLQIGT